MPPLRIGRQEDCPTGAASGPLCIVFTSFSVSWPTRFIDNTAASFHDLHRNAFSSPFGRHVLHSIQSFGGSFVVSICILFDEFVFDGAHVTDRKSCKGSGQELCSSCTGHHPVLGT